MNRKFVKITAIVIATALILGLFAEFAFGFVFAENSAKSSAIEKIETEFTQSAGQRFRLMCERGLDSYVSIIFSAKSSSDFVDRIVIARELDEYDKSMIRAISKVKNEISKNSSEGSVN